MVEYKIEVVDIKIPEGVNIILGISHFIKSVEDIYEALADSAPSIKFGIAFCEASGKRLVRRAGNDEELIDMAINAALKIGAGHTFIIFIRDAYPINVLPRLKTVPEVCSILAATANPLQVIVVETPQGRGVIGVVDGYTPKGVEDRKGIEERKEIIRKLGYKEG
ncbi:MAG: adenosine monophosphate-protein transferase [Thermofilum sp. ex4484_15]|nr:MAG: adenosine monophosphate-protein transferase [Thermofilum sp. ex4484_15]